MANSFEFIRIYSGIFGKKFVGGTVYYSVSTHKKFIPKLDKETSYKESSYSEQGVHTQKVYPVTR